MILKERIYICGEAAPSFFIRAELLNVIEGQGVPRATPEPRALTLSKLHPILIMGDSIYV